MDLKKLKTSQYNVCFQKTSEKVFFVYNTFSTALLQIDESLYNYLKQGHIPSIEEDSLALLKNKGFIVDIDCNGPLEYLHYYNRTRFGESAGFLKIVIIPTYQCNLSCAYCLQGKGEKTDTVPLADKLMATTDAEKIISFIKSKLEDPSHSVPLRKLHIIFHGGEPLIGFKICEFVADQTSRLASIHNLGLTFSMTTNLTLLRPEIVSFMKKYDVSLQVTIDGNETQHNARRHFKNKDGTYSLILQNLTDLVSQGLKKNIVIRINLDSETMNNAKEIIDEVREYSDDIYFGYLRTFKGINEGYASKCLDDACSALYDRKLSEIYQKNGLPIPASFGKKGPCSLNCENKFYIDPLLDVYKCELLIDQPRFSVGHLNDLGEFISLPEYYRQMSWGPDRFEKCINCALLPCCGGGCPAAEKDTSKKGILNATCQLSMESLVQHLENYLTRQL